jgi:hypothetical protein
MSGFSRRDLLKYMTFAGAAMGAGQLIPAFVRAAETSSFSEDDHPFLIFCTFDGGWDQLLACDPRDATDSSYGEGKTIDPAYATIAANSVDADLSDVINNVTGGTGVFTPAGSAISVGAAMHKLADTHWQDLCIVRGLDMGTLTHEVGKRYFLTGKFPRGLAANGSSMTTAAVSSMGELTSVPNLVVGMETYNEGLPSFASGLSLSSPSDILAVVASLEERLAGNTKSVVDGYTSDWNCDAMRMDGQGVVSQWMDAWNQAEILASGELAEYFNFLTDDPGSSAAEAMDFFGLSDGPPNQIINKMAGPWGQVFLAGQAVRNSVCQSVSIRLASGIDHHDDDWESLHGPALREGFDALSALISFLKQYKDTNGKPLWDRTVIVASSDFARTPKRNSRGGRDHHLSSSCVVAGKGIKGNQVIGGTDATYTRELIDPATGAVGGTLMMRPPDVHATILKAIDVSYEHISNQDPTLITAMLEDG